MRYRYSTPALSCLAFSPATSILLSYFFFFVYVASKRNDDRVPFVLQSVTRRRYIFALPRQGVTPIARSLRRRLVLRWFPGRASGSPRAQNQVNNVSHTRSFLNACEDGWSIPSHELRISIHDGERGRYQRGDVDLLDSKTGVVNANSHLLC